MWGGVFALSDAVFAHFDKDARPSGLEGALLSFNARSALSLLLQYRQPAKVWLPAYLCPALLTALPPDQNWEYYALNGHLQLGDAGWLEQLSPGDLVVAIAYLGFAPDPGWLAELRARGAEILLDASQALYLKPTHSQDYLLYSPRKWGGLSDGGILLGPNLPDSPLTTGPPPAWALMHKAQGLRREYEVLSMPNPALQAEWFGLFRQAEALQPVAGWAITGDSLARLKPLWEDPTIPVQRRDNYQRLCSALGEWALFPDLPPETVPLGFAICATQRNALQAKLAEARIYCPVYWDLAEHVPSSFEDSHRLSAQILSLPCDQRYTAEDMDKIAAQVLALKHLL